MKIFGRILGAGLSLSLLLGTLAGCGQGGTSPSASPSATAAPLTGGAAAPLVETEDVTQKLLGYSRDTTLFTVDGAGVSAEEYLYWLGYAVEYVGYYQYGDPANIEWDKDMDGVSMKEYLMNSAKDLASYYQVIRNQAKEKGITLSDEEEAELGTTIASEIAQMGGEDAYAAYLQNVGRSDEGLRQMLATDNYLYKDLRAALFPVGEADADTLAKWAQDNGKMQVKHILFKTVDDSGAALSDEEKAAKKQKAEETLVELKAAADMETLFDQRMNELSEDGRTADGALGKPGGYFFGAGEMVQEFEDAAKALKEHELSGIVETTYGYHILLRLPIDTEMAKEAWVQVQESEADSKMNDQITKWLDAAVIETTEQYKALDPKSYYEKLAAYRSAAEESVAPTGSAAPTESAAPGGSVAPTSTPAG